MKDYTIVRVKCENAYCPDFLKNGNGKHKVKLIKMQIQPGGVVAYTPAVCAYCWHEMRTMNPAMSVVKIDD